MTRVASGRDFQSSVMGNTTGTGIGTGAFAPANYMAVSASATAIADTDLTLPGEISTAGGGLVRKQCVYAHTAGAASYTLTAVFTVNASDTGLPVTLAKMAILNAASGGTMVFESAIAPTVTLSAVGDQVTITETVNI